MRHLLLSFAFFLLSWARPAGAETPFAPSLDYDLIDDAMSAEWVGGKLEERSFADANRPERPIRWPLASFGGEPLSNSEVRFGAKGGPGPRHLRFGFRSEVPIGSAIVGGNMALSILKPDAPYPGDPGDDSHWLPGERLGPEGVTTAQAPGRGSVALWVFPPHTVTRAVRLTHTAAPLDPDATGYFSGLYPFAERFTNLAPEAVASTRANPARAHQLNNEGLRDQWENLDFREGDRADTVAETPEVIELVWPQPVTIQALGFLAAGFGGAEVATYAGPPERHPREALEEDWKPLALIEKITNRYPIPLRLDWAELEPQVTTRALRLRLNAPINENHPHMNGRTREGKRVWLAEWLVLAPLGEAPLASALPTAESTAEAGKTDGLIPIEFTLPEEGYATLVIEDANGVRVRNLVSETPFPKGKNTVWWDGTDDLGRDQDAAGHGVYRIPPRLVEPGQYRVRGLWRKALNASYQMSFYTEGTPPWNTGDHTGAWLANHSAPQAAVYLPAAKSPINEPVVLLGAYVTEGPDGLIWVDESGRKRGGRKWIGGTWTGAPYLAADLGAQANKDHLAYVASVWETGKGAKEVELRVTALTRDKDAPVLNLTLGARESGAEFASYIGGLAVRDGVVAVALSRHNQVRLFSATDGALLGTLSVPAPKGVFFDAKGALLVLSEKNLLRFHNPREPKAAPRVVISSGLEAPEALTLDASGQIYISDRGKSHQVKIFSPSGKPVRQIGKPGEPKAGPYDPLHLNHPAGLAVDGQGRLWVTENDFMPKRTSLWDEKGNLVRAFYGPTKYGGGGALDPQEPTRFYYADGMGLLEFHHDWKPGSDRLVNVLFRRWPEGVPAPFREQGPQSAIHREGKRYFHNSFNRNPTNGGDTVSLYIEGTPGEIRPTTVMGNAYRWGALKTEAFKPHWPEGIDLVNERHPHRKPVFFLWNDLNGDSRPQPEEVSFAPIAGRGITVMPDLSFIIANYDGKIARFAPRSFNEAGVPLYNAAEPEIVLEGTQSPASSGGNQALVSEDGQVIVSLGLKPFARESLSGGAGGKALWSYPSPWPGLHAGHRAPRPSFPGQVLASTRLLGGFVEPKGSEVGPLWAINGNYGNVYLFTQDGLFVATLFEDTRIGKPWRMPKAESGMSLEGFTLGEENFWPTITQTREGQVYLIDGARAALVRLDGLETLRPIAPQPLEITAETLTKAQSALAEAEAQRHRQEGRGILPVARLSAEPMLVSLLAQPADQWVNIDRSGVRAHFNANSRPYDVRGLVAVQGERLHALWSTGNPKLLANSGDQPHALFKTGGALDLMLGTDPKANPKRREPVAGDLRLLVTLVEGKPRALLYRPVAPGSKKEEQVPFSSPWRTITFDRVEDVSNQVTLEADALGNYHVSIPLATLGLKPEPGLRLQGDIGLLRGSGGETNARIYWNNKATGIVSDVPAEAQLTPALWGLWEFAP